MSSSSGLKANVKGGCVRVVTDSSVWPRGVVQRLTSFAHTRQRLHSHRSQSWSCSVELCFAFPNNFLAMHSLAQPASRAVVQRADAGIFPTSFTLAKGVSESMTSSSQGDLFKGDIDTLPMDSLLDTVNVDAPRRAGTDAGKAADVDEAKAAALRSAIAGSDVGLSPKEKQAAKQAAFAAKQAADSAKGFSISLPNPF